MIAIVDYGMGNLRSVFNAIEILGFNPNLVADPEDLYKYDHVILPGVGSFRVCMENLVKTGFDESLKVYIKTGKPLMGICLGMQILASRGYEDGDTAGLNQIPGEVKKFNNKDQQLKIPHVGWNDVIFNWAENHPLAKKIKRNNTFYFTHSYFLDCFSEEYKIGHTIYGEPFTTAILKDNVFATQFHPEKSQEIGLKLFQNFINWNP